MKILDAKFVQDFLLKWQMTDSFRDGMREMVVI